ncbi:glycosyl transferase family protein [Flavobacterium sp. W21_SRS_FM6]|uniref:glycosyl transferase family protein n=1 Tax=Flavobacterium sp. W21_SRS_FM6 TaxID=3240268 RepID=UPI003F8E43A7
MLEPEITDFKHFIRLIGRGQRAGRSLTIQEAQQAMTMLINGEATPEQKGAFLMLLRVREETAEELAGFTLAFRAFNHSGLAGLNVDLDMGCYAGKRRHLPWFLLAAILLAQQGKRVFLHGTHEPDSKRLYLKEVLPHLGLSVSRSVEQAQGNLDNCGLAYMDLALLNPQLEEIIQLRDQFGLRSCANTLARMLNPSAAPYSLQGVFHRNVDIKHSETACLLNEKNVLCFRGEGGEIEFNPERDVSLHIARSGQAEVCEVSSATENWALKPKELVASYMLEVWRSDTTDHYAEQAIIGTLAIMLVLTEHLAWHIAIDQAKQYWSARNKVWPFELPKSPDALAFNTQGKFYAH